MYKSAGKTMYVQFIQQKSHYIRTEMKQLLPSPSELSTELLS